MADKRPQPTSIMTPLPQPRAHPLQQQHPRRPPAHRSVSLLHSPRQKLPAPIENSDSSSDSAVLSRQKTAAAARLSDSPSSLQPLGRESSGGSSNADKWFEKSNNEVRDNSASFADNDPPFFMRNSSSSETPPEAQQLQLRQLLASGDGANSLPLRTGLLQLGTDGSSTEDFRSVIDDLTIENKKLKRRLKKYEKLHDSHLRDEKLFEVRIHGLPSEKKRELEETLRKFASSLGTSSFPANGYEGLLPVLQKQYTAPSQTSVHHTDSAYASMSASGQGSSAPSGNEAGNKPFASSAASRRQNIHSYLHHIPEGLLSHRNPANMTERAKKRLVVRRLEQVFAGKGATAGGHQHSLQQQDVSHMAARADKLVSEAQGVQSSGEGTREAHIMRQEVEDPTDPATKPDGDNTSPDEGSNSRREIPQRPAKGPGAATEQDSAEQRPTRPLDLDPYRAQVPADNFRYMRHLGFSPPEPGSHQLQEEGHGWIYLNLLVNMAQLHTINVTAEFVKKALTEYSSKFELSNDGRKVRWKGGRSVTRTSSSGGASSGSRYGVDTPDGQSPRKRPKLSHQDTGRSAGSHMQSGAVSNLRNQAENNKLVYTPLFFHKDSTDDAEDSSEEEDDSMSSPFPAPVAGDSSGMTSSGVRTTSTKKPKKRDDGPIIFYSNARFCTDLSGDRNPAGNVNAPPYTAVSDVPVGQPQSKPVDYSTFEKRGPLAKASQLPEPMDLSDNPIPESMELSFPAQLPMRPGQQQPAKEIDMEVTGIGGVWPADHFSISVESRYARIDQDAAPAVPQMGLSKNIPLRFAKILQGSSALKRKASAPVHNEIVAARKRDLPPSKLPPALSFMPFSEDSQEDDESDIDDGMSVSPESPGAMPPSTAPQPVELHYASSGDEEVDDDGDDESDDGSLDLLAAAREVDPEAIRQKEREYDANMAERLAEEIPAGSSAATAGGGSGFASPASAKGMSREEYQRAVREARQRPASMKRTTTTDSMKVQDPRTKDSSSSDEEEEDDEMDDAAS